MHKSGREIGEYYELLSTYSVSGEFVPGPDYISYADNGFNAIRIEPFWLLRAGDLGGSAYLSNAGRRGTYWFATTNGDGTTYSLSIVPNGFYASRQQSGNSGNTVRCVAE